MNFLKIIVKNIIKFFVSLGAKWKIGNFINNEVVNGLMSLRKNIIHNNIKLIFSTPNMLNNFRADTFSTKEPETLEWIESMDNGSTMWDIGANVGLYSIYASKIRSCRVYAFEPSVFNLELLARNIFNNDLVEYITIIPLPLSNELKINSLNMTTTEWGGALSTFGEKYGHDGKELSEIFKFNTIGLSMEDAVKLLNIPSPDYVKMDVDGIEHLILKGGSVILKKIKSILVEVNEDYKEQDINVSKILTEAGLVLKEKRHSEIVDGSQEFGQTYNQIWHRV